MTSSVVESFKFCRDLTVYYASFVLCWWRLPMTSSSITIPSISYSTMDTSRTPDRAPVGQSKMESLITHQEIFLRILAFLDTPNSLSRVQGVNSYWASMALDPQVSNSFYIPLQVGSGTDMFSYAERYSSSFVI